MEEIEAYQTFYSIAKPVIDPIIVTFIKPKLDGLDKWLKKDQVKSKIVENFFESKFENYLHRTYQKFSFINTIVFPNQQIKLLDIYTPVELINTKTYSAVKSNNIDSKFLSSNNRILVSDYAGMGKSTLSRFLTNHCITQNFKIPIYIELRHISPENDIRSEITNQVNPLDDDFDSDLLLEIIKKGDFLIILDGFDEIPVKNQEFVIKEVTNFMTKASKNNFIITSRPESALSSFGDCQNYFIKPLSKDEAFNIIDKYNNISYIKIGDKLKSEIEERFDQIKDFLSNPFLVSLLFKSYTYNKDIPLKRVTFYDDVYNALYKAHDLSKDGYKRQKKSQLDIQDFRVILRDLAFNTAKLRQVEYSEQELLDFIAKSKQNCTGLEFKVNDFLEDMLLSVPIILRDGNKLKWAHKSIQDYFAAEFICFHQKKETILDRIFRSGNEAFLNSIALFVELDNKTFRKTILLNLLKDYNEYFEKSYSEFVSTETIRFRKCITYGIQFCFLKCPKSFDKKTVIDSILKKMRITDLTLESVNDRNDLVIFYNSSFRRQLLELIHSNYSHLLLKVALKGKKKKTLSIKNKIEYHLTDKPNDVLNSKRNFSTTNEYILKALRGSSRTGKNKFIILDIEKAKKEIEKIKMEVDEEVRVDILDGI